LDDNLNNGFVCPSNSSHGAPILFIKKYVNFCGLNKISKKDRYPLPLISDLLDSPGKAQIYTKIDLRHTYHLVRSQEDDEWKTTFHTKYRSFEWLVMLSGLSNAPSAFQHFMNNAFTDMLDVCVVVYLDNILIYSSDKTTHHKQVKEVLCHLQKHGSAEADDEFLLNKDFSDDEDSDIDQHSLAPSTAKRISIFKNLAPISSLSDTETIAPSPIHSIYGTHSSTPNTTLTLKLKDPWGFKAECSNCGATHTSLWRQGLNDELNDNVCQLYWKLVSFLLHFFFRTMKTTVL
jgi:hypothetical protein